MSPPPSADRCTVTIVGGRDGGPAEVHKEARSPERRERLAREAATLRRGRHPGVVDLVELREGDDVSVLVTRLIGTHTLATWSDPSLDEIAGAVVAVAETLADLHHLGLAHGAIEADHIVLDPRGHPVLCGFDRSRDHRPTDDVAALGHLVRRLLEADDGTGPDPRSTRRVPRRHAVARRRLLDLADQAIDPDLAVRPGARRFAAAVLAAVPTATLGDDRPTRGTRTAADDAHPGPARADAHRPRHRPPEPPMTDRGPEPDAPRASQRRGSRGALTAATVVGLACLVFGALSAWTGERPELGAASIAAPAPTRPVGSAPTGSAPGSTSVPVSTAPTAPAVIAGPAGADADLAAAAARCAPSGSSPAATPAGPDAAAAPCSAVQFGGIVDHDGSRFALGDAADELVLGSDRCPDQPAVALLRPADGAVYLFDAWAEPGRDEPPRAAGSVPPGSHWAALPLDPTGCAPLAAVDPSGAVHAVLAASPDPPPASPPTAGAAP